MQIRQTLLSCSTITLLCCVGSLPLVATAQQLDRPALTATASPLVASLDNTIPAASESSSSVPEGLPDAPQAASQPPVHQDGQTKRILGIIPNFRAVNADVKLPPQSVKDKFITASQDSFDYSSILLPTLLAGYSQATNATPEFRQGGIGYGRYLWHSTVDQDSENYFVEFIVPAITREDTRYYTLGKGGFLKRTEYSLSRAIITRNDAGKETFNAGEVIGAGAAAGVSNLYYPSRERTFGNTAGKWGQNVGIDAATFMFKEFWPDINHYLFHGKTQQN
ncbi:hypothetical protein [Granulicella arctica]|uniref:Uncharacterized protein n=1 Tax=Granulicella arctica TaxID=940613 RepID=A0A7Y9PEL9_9BACT|nr:hypothetical protein [Granulicella arctica]NYF78270.1 hypothetical protein [Granulicella arctica]